MTSTDAPAPPAPAPPVPEALRPLVVGVGDSLLTAMRAIDRGREGIAFVCDAEGRVLGSLTDGDVRRAILGGARPEDCCLDGIMRREFARVGPEATRAEVVDLLRARVIAQVPALDADGRLVALHTLRDLIGPTVRPNAALILAGGKGTRLRPLTENVPKPMIPVAGRPILERLVLHLVGMGVRRIFLSVNYLSHIIEEHFGDGERFGCRIEYVHETQPLSTGGPLALLPPQEHPLLVLNGDLVTQADVGKMLEFHAEGGHAATFGVRPYQVDVPFGVAEVDGDRLIALKEKPTLSMLVNAGIYALSPEAIARVPRGVEYPITDLFNQCLADGLSVGVHLIQDEWADVGRHDELRRARGAQ